MPEQGHFTTQDIYNDFVDAADMEPDALSNLYGGTDLSSVPQYNYDAQFPPDIKKNIDEILTDWKPPANFLRFYPMRKTRSLGGDIYADSSSSQPQEPWGAFNSTDNRGGTMKQFLDWQGAGDDWADNWGDIVTVGASPHIPWSTFRTESLEENSDFSPHTWNGYSYWDMATYPNALPGDPDGYGTATGEVLGDPRLTDLMAGHQYPNIESLDAGLAEATAATPNANDPPWWGAKGSSSQIGNDPPYSYMSGELGEQTRWPFGRLTDAGFGGTAPTPNAARLEARVDDDYANYFQGSGYGNWPGYSLTGLTDLFNNGSVARALTEAGDKGTALTWAPTITRDQLKRLGGDHYTPQLKNARKGLLDEYQKNLNWASNIGKGFESYGGRNRATEQATAGYRAGIGKELGNINEQQAGAREEIEDTLAQWRELVV